jgi:protein dithiol oxidoreductase (disulfide-forming)
MKKLLALALAACALAALPAAAQPKFSYSELKPALQVEADGKIEVLEFFWYGCIHCYNLEPMVEKWEKTLPKDVQFRRVPAVFNDRWAIDASIFYTFEAMGLLDKLHRPLFDAIHKERLRTDSQKEVMEWLTKQGVDTKKFTDTMKSFGVQSKMRRAAQMTALYKIDGTPAMAVHGRYTVSTDQGRTQAGMFDTVNYLADTIRKQK